MEELEVPPMAVQTLVENSIKYAIAPAGRAGKSASARLESGSLVLAVSDDGPGFDLGPFRRAMGWKICRSA